MARIRQLSSADAPRASDLAVIEEVGKLLTAGKVVVFPTDTVYGLMAALEPTAAAHKLNRVKGRAEAMPVAALVNASERLLALVAELNKRCSCPLVQLVPGPLTLVIPRELARGVLPSPLLSLPYAGIGFRVPNYPLLNILIERTGDWIMATSANPAGGKEGQSLKSSLQELPQEAVALAVDGGKLEGTASGVIEFTGSSWRILRGHPRLEPEPAV